MSTWFITSSGRQFDPFSAGPEDIHIEDIAHGLSQICRFGGHTKKFYSVAQHSVLVSDLVSQTNPEHALTALLHDATEAYIGDMIRPIKYEMPEFMKLEARLWKVIAERFGVPEELPHIIKDCDNIALQTERRDLLTAHPWKWHESIECFQPANRPVHPFDPDSARAFFMLRFRSLEKTCPVARDIYPGAV